MAAHTSAAGRIPPPMDAESAADLFRRGLLDGQVVVMAGGGGEVAEAVVAACDELGAAVERPTGDPLDEAGAADFAAGVVERRGGLHTLVVEAGAAFARAVPEAAGAEALRAAADPTWVAARAAATAAMIDAEGGGKVVVVAPPPGAGPGAVATRSAPPRSCPATPPRPRTSPPSSPSWPRPPGITSRGVCWTSAAPAVRPRAPRPPRPPCAPARRSRTRPDPSPAPRRSPARCAGRRR